MKPMWLTIALSIGAVLAVLGLLLVISIRALRKFVRSFWPH